MRRADSSFSVSGTCPITVMPWHSHPIAPLLPLPAMTARFASTRGVVTDLHSQGVRAGYFFTAAATVSVSGVDGSATRTFGLLAAFGSRRYGTWASPLSTTV